MIYPSIDKLLLHVDSKYRLVHIVAERSNDMLETKRYQLPEGEYKSSKTVGKALEEVERGLVEIKKD